MPPTPLTATTRYIPQGTTKYFWLPAIVATTGIPTLAEITAGTDLTPEVAAVTGFSVTGAQVDTPDAASRFVSRVPGLITPDDSSISLYASKDGDDASTFFSIDQTGFVMFANGGNTAGLPAEQFPVTVTSVTTMRELTAATLVVVSFALTSEPVTFDIPST